MNEHEHDLPTEITPAEIHTAMESGYAEALLPEGVPGPVHHAGRWWAIPAGQSHYQQVSPAQAAALDDHHRRLRRAGELLRTETHQQDGEQG